MNNELGKLQKKMLGKITKMKSDPQNNLSIREVRTLISVCFLISLMTDDNYVCIEAPIPRVHETGRLVSANLSKVVDDIFKLARERAKAETKNRRKMK